MSADVHESRMYQAFCSECGWYGDQYESAGAADEDADEHDADNHEDS